MSVAVLRHLPRATLDQRPQMKVKSYLPAVAVYQEKNRTVYIYTIKNVKKELYSNQSNQ